MAKHGLTEADFQEDVVEVADDQRDPGRRELARVIAISRRCTSLASKRGIAFRGRPEAVRRAVDVYRSLTTTCSASCEIGPRDPGRHVWRICYWNGFVEAVTERLIDREVQKEPPPPSEEPPPMPSEPDPSILETKRAFSDFASHFYPGDVHNGMSHLTADAHRAGKSHGSSVAIEDYRAEEQSAARTLAGVSG